MRTTDTPIPAQLTVVAWPDPGRRRLGFLPHDPYSELVWTLMSEAGVSRCLVAPSAGLRGNAGSV